MDLKMASLYFVSKLRPFCKVLQALGGNKFVTKK